MSLIDYIHDNRQNIVNFNQGSFSIVSYKEAQNLAQIEQFRTLTGEIPDFLNREDVIECFKNKKNYYKAFLYAMMWGVINNRRPRIKGNLQTTPAFRAFSFDSKRIVKIITDTKDLLELNRVGEAYLKFYNENRIPEVGESYFTKLLFFIGMTTNIEKPLIYDSFARIIHVAILLSENQKENLINYYSSSCLNDIITKKGLRYQGNNMREPAYMDYVERMNDIANKNDIDVIKLDAYLFGKTRTLKAHKNMDNPRFWILQYIRENSNIIHIHE